MINFDKFPKADPALVGVLIHQGRVIYVSSTDGPVHIEACSPRFPDEAYYTRKGILDRRELNPGYEWRRVDLNALLAGGAL